MTQIYLYAQATLTQPELIKTLKRLKRHAKLGFYIEAEQIKNLWVVKLFGPKIYWKRKISWEVSNAKQTRFYYRNRY